MTAPGTTAGTGAEGTAYTRRQAILDASPEWRFRTAVDRFQRVTRAVEGHIGRHGAAPLPDEVWAEEQVAKRELMAFDPSFTRHMAGEDALGIAQGLRMAAAWHRAQIATGVFYEQVRRAHREAAEMLDTMATHYAALASPSAPPDRAGDAPTAEGDRG